MTYEEIQRMRAEMLETYPPAVEIEAPEKTRVMEEPPQDIYSVTAKKIEDLL